MNQDQEIDYRQELGLKKILYKYENQNQQLKSQIKALNQKLQWIINKPKTPLEKVNLNPIQQYQGQILKQEMLKLYKSIQKNTEQMKINKDSIDERHQQKCQELQNKILKQQKQIKQLKYKLQKYETIDEGIKLNELSRIVQTPVLPAQFSATPQVKFDPSAYILSNNKTLRSSTIRYQNYLQKLNSIKEETEKIRKSIKQLEHTRDQNERNLIKKHIYQTDFKQNNKVLENGERLEQMVDQSSSIKRKGVWGLQNTKQNYDFVSNQLEKLKRQKNFLLQSIRNQNIVLQNKIHELQTELQGIEKTVEIPPLPYQKRSLKIPLDLSISTKIESPLLQKKLVQPIFVGPTQFQRKNDKNFVAKTARKVEWQSTKNSSGIQWDDSHIKSVIIGLNLWFDGYLIGIQLLHEVGSSDQHFQAIGGKKFNPIQYRLGSNDYIQNVILYISQGLIYGIQLVSKNDRLDKFGNISKARKFDFGIKKPQKPIVSFGRFRINNNLSQITKLGFLII